MLMGNTNKDSDQDYMALRSRTVPKRQVEFEDAESGSSHSGIDVAEGRSTEAEKGTMETRRGENEAEREGQLLRESESGNDQAYGELVHDVQQATREAMAPMFRELCDVMKDVMQHETQARGQIAKVIIECATDRKLALALYEQSRRDAQGPGVQFKEPMPFSGDNAREWLMQMRQYYDLRGFSKAQRLSDAPFRLRGDAHLFYYTLAQHYPERLPKT